MQKLKLYPSASAFMDAGLVETQYSNGCQRMVLAKSFGYDEGPIPSVYMRLGAYDEDQFSEKLVDRGYSCVLEEIPFKFTIPDTAATLSGRMDFMVWEDDAVDAPLIIEKKATMSKPTIYAARKGRVKINQLAQLVSYLVVHDLPRGILHLNGYKLNKKEGPEFIPTFERATKKVDEFAFEITFSKNREILVNGVMSGFTVLNYVDYLQSSAQMLTTPYLPKRPGNADGGWNSPCNFCKIKGICDSADSNQETTVNDFIIQTLTPQGE